METEALQNLADNIAQITDEATATEYLASKQNELANSYVDVAASALWAMTQIDGFANSPALQNAYNSAKAQYEQIKSLFSNTRSGLSLSFSGKSSSSSSSSSSSDEEDYTDLLEKYLDLYDAELDAGITDFDTYLKKSKVLLDEYYRDGKISAAEYYDYLGDLYDKQLKIYDKVVSAVTRRYDKEIDKIQKLIDALEDQNDAYEDQLSNLDGILSVINSVYEAEIERIQEQQDAIDDTISKLQDENDERQLALDLEEARYQLYRAQNQRSVKLYNGTEYVYTTNQDDIRDAQQNLADLELEKTISDLEKQRDALDDVIEELEKYRDLWADITDVYEEEQNKQLAIAMFGANYESVILSNRISDIESFKNNYVSIQKQIDSNEALIDSYNEKITYYEDLKQQWEDLTSAYEESIEDQYAAQILGANWESEILDGRIDTLNTFKNNYAAIQQAIVDLAWQSANAQIAAAKEAEKGANGTAGSTTLKDTATAETPYKWTLVNDGNGKTIASNFSDVQTALRYAAASGGYEVKGVDASSHKIKVYKKKAYASGTTNAKKGLNLVGEEGTEAFVDNNDNVTLVTEPSLVPMEGGETVYNASETKSLLDDDNLIPLNASTPLIQGLSISELSDRWKQMMPDYSSLAVPNFPTAKLNNGAQIYNNSTPVIQNITLTLPNVTNNSGYERIQKELKQMQIDAVQYARRK
jgi:chromosome segregation ATPase